MDSCEVCRALRAMPGLASVRIISAPQKKVIKLADIRLE